MEGRFLRAFFLWRERGERGLDCVFRLEQRLVWDGGCGDLEAQLAQSGGELIADVVDHVQARG